MKYRITLNNKVYEVEVEKEQAQIVSEAAAPAPAPAAVPAPVPAAPAPAPAAPSPEPEAGQEAGDMLSAPMPGTIVGVNVSVGSQVKQGDVLFVLEAMKMENEIVSPRDATVAKVSVQKGDAVNFGDPLAWLA